MASAHLFTHERHSNPHILARDDTMKKVPKIAKLNMEAPSDPRTLKRKSMSLNYDGNNSQPQGGPATATVDISDFTRDQMSELRKKLKLNLDQVRGIASRIEAREEFLHQLKPQLAMAEREGGVNATDSDANLRLDNNGHARKDVTSVVSDPASSSGETPRDMPREMSQREARLARQPGVMVPEASFGTPGVQSQKRTPKANQLYVNSEFVSGMDKMPPPEKQKVSKKALQGKPDARDPKRQKLEAARMKRVQDFMKQCLTVLRKLMTHKHGWVFNEPVDAEKMGLHDYHTVIKKPMDLGTVKKRLNMKQYPTPLEFADDIALTFTNAMTYNPVGHDVYKMAETLKGRFEEWWVGMVRKMEDEKKRVEREEDALAGNDGLQDIEDHLRRVEKDLLSLSKLKPVRPAAQPKPRPEETGKRPMTFDEKRKLSVNLEGLPGDKLERIVQIIKKRNPDLGQNEDEIEVDIDSFDNDTLWELDRFVTNYMKSKGKKVKPKAQVQRSAAAQIPGAGTDAVKKSRAGGEAGEEDVDIDDDMAPTKFAPVVIDNAKESSSSSSGSSDSGSSSSDSDSASSSASESDAENVQSAGAGPKASHDKEAETCQSVADNPPLPLQDPVGSGPVCDVKGSSTPPPTAAKLDVETRPLTMISPREEVMLEEKPLEKVLSPERSSPERQVSPEKLLRAALLRGRYADLIVKAQQKSLPISKNDKGNPEMLRKEREELEKRQREEKARLQAEAKAAQATKRKAEAQAALLEKQKRELEREEARRALQQMERTVEIDENSGILKDLERLRSGPLDQLLGSSHEADGRGEMSPKGLSTFALQGGGNPLEQLGLFMKDDDDDEDEPHEEEEPIDTLDEGVEVDLITKDGEATITKNHPDVEDGEIDME